MAVLNHIGHCVSDIERSERFYVEVFGFTVARAMDVPDRPTDKLLGLPAPLGVRASYLEKEGFVLELLRFGLGENPKARDRAMNEPGLTHFSFSVDDIAATCAAVVQHGGSVIEDSDLGGLAIFVRDPDGQRIELLPMSYRQSLG